MKRKYELDLLENIKKNQREVEYEGVKVLVKPIPEGGEPGDMDQIGRASCRERV